MEEEIVHRERRILLCTSPVVVRQHWTDIDKQCVLCCKSHSLTYPSALLYHLYRFQLRCHLRSLETNTRSRDTIGCNPLPVCSFWAEIHGATTTSQEIYSSQPSKRIITFHRFMHTTWITACDLTASFVRLLLTTELRWSLEYGSVY